MIATICIPMPKVQAQSFNGPDLKLIIDDNIIREGHGLEIIDGNIFIPVRKYCEMFGARVLWKSNIDKVLIFSDDHLHIPKTKIVNTKAMMSVFNLEHIFGYNIKYFDDYNIIHIDTGNSKFSIEKIYEILPSFDGYTEEDLKWLSRIIHAEANGESYEGKLAVGNVIMNRKKDDMYPDTIKEVIFDNRNGVQFAPTLDGSINKSPSTESWIAAVEVLEGKGNAKGVLFFMNSSIAQSTWISSNRELAFTMQNHDFFY